MKRWIWGGLLAGLGLGAAGLLYATRIERAQIELSQFTVELEKPGIPPRGLTILHLSDFHFHADGAIQDRKLERLKTLLGTEQYDVVAVTGDLIHDTGGLPAAFELIRTLRPRLGIYFVPGNHDYAEYTPWGVLGQTWRESSGGAFTLDDLKTIARSLAAFVRKVAGNELVRMPICFNDVPAILAELARQGVHPLVNTSERLQAEGLDVWFAGVDDAMESTPDLSAALEGVPPGAPLVLLSHNPDIWLQCEVERADLVLAGHTHGGQIQLPMMGAIHTQGTHLGRRKPAGWFTRNRSKMFVSRGIGESIPLRFSARPQAAVIRLVRP